MNMITRRGLTAGAIAACAAPARPKLARAADSFPDRPLHFEIPFVAGGAQDIVGRAVGRQMSLQLHQNVIVDNRPGAGGNIAVSFVVRSDPDGYTVLVGANGLAANATLFDKLSFDVLKDLAPVGQIGYSPLILLVGQDSPFKTVADLIARAKATPGKISFATAGIGTSGHLAAEMFRQSAQVEMKHIPYRGGAPALLDVIAGRVDFMLVDPVQAAGQIASGQLRPIAVSSPKRLSLLPNIPTIEESGLKGPDIVVWWGLLVPVRTAPSVITKLNNELVTALKDPATNTRMTELGIVLTPGTPDQFSSFLQTETDRYRTLIQAAGMKATD